MKIKDIWDEETKLPVKLQHPPTFIGLHTMLESSKIVKL